MDLAMWLATWHGALAIGLTSYPAAEAKLTLESTLAPDLAIEFVTVGPIGKPEPISLRAGLYLTLWRF